MIPWWYLLIAAIVGAFVLFGEPSPQSSDTAAVLVRSHLRRVKGSALPDTHANRTQSPNVGRNGQSGGNAHEERLAPHNGTDTSVGAARAITRSGGSTRQEREVLACVRALGETGGTRKDIAMLTGIVESTVCARVNRMVANGVLVEDGETRVPRHGGARPQKVVRVKG